MFFFFFTVRESTIAIVESFGRFTRTAGPGLHMKTPFESVVGRVSLRVQQMDVGIETKTEDDVFVRITVAVQFAVMPDHVVESFYKLMNPGQQIESYVYDVVRSQVPGMKLDEVFRNKEDIAQAVKKELSGVMLQYGYRIVNALVNDVDPDPKVKSAMNAINEAQRLRKAAEERGEADKILKIKGAEAEAESKILQGRGIAGQRKAIIDGLRDSVEDFQRGIPGVSAGEVMQMVLMTQYFDTLKDVGQASRTNTILLPHTPGALGNIADQLQMSLMTANLATSEAMEEGTGGGSGRPHPAPHHAAAPRFDEHAPAEPHPVEAPAMPPQAPNPAQAAALKGLMKQAKSHIVTRRPQPPPFRPG
ncbi:MAG: SPFH domain-containing protein [Candidatus Sumerlaeia bacterium]|nr:SPFH domain-containing protein [Candidatus Sumerlaeia bacterium]